MPDEFGYCEAHGLAFLLKNGVGISLVTRKNNEKQGLQLWFHNDGTVKMELEKKENAFPPPTLIFDQTFKIVDCYGND